jgi:Mg2+-importing ATPase
MKSKESNPFAFWSIEKSDLVTQLKSSEQGLSAAEAAERLTQKGYNSLTKINKPSRWLLFLNQFKSPVTLILIFAALLSLSLGDWINMSIILFIILISAFLGFWQEAGAQGAVEKLLSLIRIQSAVTRDGITKEIPVEEIVTGDVITLAAGDLVPADCRILHSTDLFVNEASLTGETFPVEKSDGLLPADTGISKRSNSLFMGTYVVSGTAGAIVARTGTDTEFGNIAQHISQTSTENEFERGTRKFGYLLMEVTLILVISIFAINIYFHRPAVDSLLFSLALAVGLTPQLLPAIISINLAHGAKRMAQSQVIVKKLSAIENFGTMNVLCSDKTGTITEGNVKVKDFLNAAGEPSRKVFLYGYLNSFYETGFKNPIDAAIVSDKKEDVSRHPKTDEIPYDFIRKRLSIVVKDNESHLMITKGAFKNILEVCAYVECRDHEVRPVEAERENLLKQFEDLSRQGLRVIAIAYKKLNGGGLINASSETGLTFLGFIALYDPLKEGIVETIEELKQLGIRFKIITGDNSLIATETGKKVFNRAPVLLTGSDMRNMSDEALVRKVSSVDLFAEVEPNQKERILLALQKNNLVVGYMGDGINDATALHAADVGISVDSAVDVAKESADIILLNKDLKVLMAGVKEGRKTFSNTLKYILMATSANFGNMFSMAGASLFLSYLPLLPSQILLTNLLTDLPEMTIANDNVEESMIVKPRRWNLSFIKKFMISFGLLSSVFDFATFGTLLLLLDADEKLFRTGWFVESVISASLIVLVVRTPGTIFKSRPGHYLVAAVISIVILTFLLPYSPLASLLGFVPLPFPFVIAIAGMVTCYIVATELLKKIFYRKQAS